MALKKKAPRRKKSFKKIKRRKTYKRKRTYKRKKTYKSKKRLNSPIACDYRSEFGGQSISNPNAIGQTCFVGHSVAGNDVINNLFVALVKKLMAIYGMTYQSDQERIVDNTTTAAAPFYNLTAISRVTAGHETPIVSDYQIGGIDGVQTVRDVAVGFGAKWVTDIRAAILANNAGTPPVPNNGVMPIIQEIILYEGIASATAKDKLLAKLPCTRLTIDISFFSKLKIQNKTNAEQAGASGLTDLNNVNPLQGRLYKGRMGRNYFTPTFYNTQTTTIPLFVPKHDGTKGGVIGAKDTQVGSTLNCLRKLPTHKDIDFKKSVDFVLHPGQIVQDKLYFKTKISLDKLLHKLMSAMSLSYYEVLDLGVAHLLGFDKLVYDRSVGIFDGTVGVPISLGYEIENRMKVAVITKKSACAPFVYVDNAAFNV